MNKKSTPHGSKNLIIVMVLIVAAAAGFGYFKQSGELNDEAIAATEHTQAAQKAMPKPDHPIFVVRANDIVVGNPGAPVTMIEYASLSCPHCAHFFEKVYPAFKKEFIDTGKVRFAFRHFPLNEPALRGAQVVECADVNARKEVLKALFDAQSEWAFDQKFVASLKTIAAGVGIDSAQFDSCVSDANLEKKILGIRMEAANVAQVSSTPTFFINGVKLQTGFELHDLRAAIATATKK